MTTSTGSATLPLPADFRTAQAGLAVPAKPNLSPETQAMLKMKAAMDKVGSNLRGIREDVRKVLGWSGTSQKPLTQKTTATLSRAEEAAAALQDLIAALKQKVDANQIDLVPLRESLDSYQWTASSTQSRATIRQYEEEIATVKALMSGYYSTNV